MYCVCGDGLPCAENAAYCNCELKGESEEDGDDIGEDDYLAGAGHECDDELFELFEGSRVEVLGLTIQELTHIPDQGDATFILSDDVMDEGPLGVIIGPSATN